MDLKATRVEHFGIQRKMVAAMTSESWEHIPHVSYIYEPEVSAFFDEYKKLNDGRNDENKITFNTVMLKAIVEGLKEAPAMNAHIKYNRHLVRGVITTYENINISMPMILPNGEMMTVNLHDFQNKNLDEMVDYIKDVSRRAQQSDLNEAMYSASYNRTLNTIKEGRLMEALLRIIGSKTGKYKIAYRKGKARKEYYSIPETERLGDSDIQQGTITISNVGSLDLAQRGFIGLLEIIPPQICAISIGAIQERVVIKKDSEGNSKIAIGKILPLCIAFDHRALDFQDIVPFTKKLDEIFAHPETLQTWLNK